MSYPYPRSIEENINGLAIKLVGVWHTKPFFEEYKEFFKEEIGSAETILIEEGPSIFNHEFYGELARLAQERQMPVYIPDTGNSSDWFWEFSQVMMGSVLLSNAMVRGDGTPRRKFLKSCGQGLAGLYLLSGTCGWQGLSDIIKPKDKDVVLDDAIKYNVISDYRNIVSAENLNRLSKIISLRKQVPYFIGASHINGIHAYLKEPWLRKKRLLYFPQDMVNDLSIKKYNFKSGKWVLTEKI